MLSKAIKAQIDDVLSKVKQCDQAILYLFDAKSPTTTITISKEGSAPLVLPCDPIDTSFLLSFYMSWKVRYTQQLSMLMDMATSTSTPETPVNMTTSSAVRFP